MATDACVFQPEESLRLGKETLLLSSKFQNEAKNLKKKSDDKFFRVHISASISFSISHFMFFFNVFFVCVCVPFF